MSVSRLAAQTVGVLERVVRDPTLLPEVLKKMRSRLTADRHQDRLAEYANFVETPVVGLSELLSVDSAATRKAVDTDGFRRVLAELHAYEAPAGAGRMGGAGFLEACYAIVRLARPAVVLETGVAHGYSSAAILQALQDNEHGRLYSVDLPMFRPGIVSYTGGAVPTRLRSERWELNLGSDRRVLPALLKRIGPIDFFFYDSDTAYEGMRHTWELVWPHLRPGAVFIQNVVHANDAYLEFAETHRLTPMIIPQPKRQGAYQREKQRGEKSYYMGLFRKPSPTVAEE